MENFEVLSKLGDGAFSTVYKVKRKKDGKLYAMKKVKMGSLSAKEKENSLNEVRILASIKHPNIISFKDCFIESNVLCIVMEFALNGDLYGKIQFHQKNRQTISEDTFWQWTIQMVHGLKALHDMGILHRDLKCANIFLGKSNEIKLGDLNVSKVAKKSLAYTQTGTPYYASPEVWKDQPYDLKSDIWSLGCVLYEVITLKPPFRANDMQGLYKKVIAGIYDPIPSKYSSDLNNFIKALLQVTPKNRPNCDQILQMPCIKTRIGNYQIIPMQTKSNFKQELLATIKLTPNMCLLQNKLPKANYEEQKQEINQLPVDLQIQKKPSQNLSFEQPNSQRNASPSRQIGTPTQAANNQQQRILSREVQKRADQIDYNNYKKEPLLPNSAQNRNQQIPPALQLKSQNQNEKQNLYNYGNRMMNNNQPSSYLNEIASQNQKNQQQRVSRQNQNAQIYQPPGRNLTPVNKKPGQAYQQQATPPAQQRVMPPAGIPSQGPPQSNSRQQSRQQAYNPSSENKNSRELQQKQQPPQHKIYDEKGNQVKMPQQVQKAPLPSIKEEPKPLIVNHNQRSNQVTSNQPNNYNNYLYKGQQNQNRVEPSNYRKPKY